MLATYIRCSKELKRAKHSVCKRHEDFMCKAPKMFNKFETNYL